MMDELRWHRCPYCGIDLGLQEHLETAATRPQWSIGAYGLPSDRDGKILAWQCACCAGLFHRYGPTTPEHVGTRDVLGKIPWDPATEAVPVRVRLSPTLVVGARGDGVAPETSPGELGLDTVDDAVSVLTGPDESAGVPVVQLPDGAYAVGAEVLRRLGLCEHLIADRFHFGRTGRTLYGLCPACEGGTPLRGVGAGVEV